jgi:hypothetical protein
MVPALLTACGGTDNPVAPLTLSRFALLTSDGNSPPFIQTRVDFTANDGSHVTCLNKFTGMTVDLENSSRYQIAENYLQTCDNGRADVASTQLENGNYTIQGHTIQLSSDQQPTGTNVRSGTINPAFLTLDREEQRPSGATPVIRTIVLLFSKIF